MAKELKLDPIITGAREADQVIADLKAQNARVIYSLNYPAAAARAAPDADEPLSELRDRAHAPKDPGALRKPASCSRSRPSGLDRSEGLRPERGKAVKAGLAADAAIRALTINAARIAGAADRLGSIEKGKIANLIVTDGDLFDEKTKITRVFVDGRPVALETPAAPAGRGRGRGNN